MSRRLVGYTFAQFGPVDAPGVCRWCGRKLRKRFDFSDCETTTGVDDLGNSKTSTSRPGRLETFTLGDYGDGHFCGMTCGYTFGVRIADLGKRLQPSLISKKGNLQ